MCQFVFELLCVLTGEIAHDNIIRRQQPRAHTIKKVYVDASVIWVYQRGNHVGSTEIVSYNVVSYGCLTRTVDYVDCSLFRGH